MPAKSLRTLLEGAYRNSVCVQRYRVSREDAARVKEAEKIGHNLAVKVLLEILFGKPGRLPSQSDTGGRGC